MPEPLNEKPLPERVGSIGGGNMAEAILRGLLRAGFEPAQLSAADPVPERRALLARELGVRVVADNRDVAENSDLVLIAVKPNSLAEATAAVAGCTNPIYLSIVAGATRAALAGLLGAEARIVRAMPNTPALVGHGAAAVAGGRAATPTDLEWAMGILSAVGEVVVVEEALMDAVTGLSGSGPAYLFLLAEALIDAGEAEGLPRDIAVALTEQTLLGAATLLRRSDDPPATLRENVTSTGGTTAEA